jgi:ubiquinone/menaquinone biosynthesis C-methylase UbiE
LNQYAQNTARYYNNLSSRYDRLYSSYLTHTHQKLLDRIGISTFSNSAVLDVSAGTGTLAEELIEKFGPPARLVLNDPGF